jgi:hypothetical protein
MPARAQIRQYIRQIAGTARWYYDTIQQIMRHVCKLPPLGL